MKRLVLFVSWCLLLLLASDGFARDAWVWPTEPRGSDIVYKLFYSRSKNALQQLIDSSPNKYLDKNNLPAGMYYKETQNLCTCDPIEIPADWVSFHIWFVREQNGIQQGVWVYALYGNIVGTVNEKVPAEEAVVDYRDKAELIKNLNKTTTYTPIDCAAEDFENTPLFTTIQWSDMDQNGTVNSTDYLKWIIYQGNKPLP